MEFLENPILVSTLVFDKLIYLLICSDVRAYLFKADGQVVLP
jgi:hypothetical protein